MSDVTGITRGAKTIILIVSLAQRTYRGALPRIVDVVPDSTLLARIVGSELFTIGVLEEDLACPIALVEGVPSIATHACTIGGIRCLAEGVYSLAGFLIRV